MKICAVCDQCFADSEATCHGDLKSGTHSIDAVPGYSIQSVIRSLPTASVYRARSVEYGRECVITIVDGDTRQFIADASSASRLFSANISAVIESGELPDGSAYAVTEAVGAISLRGLLSETPLSLLDQIRIARQTAEAVHTLHAAGILHGAIRPENISVSGFGTDALAVQLHNIDLGSSIANAVLSNRFVMDSATDVIKYMAPERFQKESSLRSDVYGLGLVLYELLSGHPPFEGSSAKELIDSHVNQRPPEIKIQNFDLRMLLTHTLTESLQKKPEFRQATADLFARQLRHIEQLATHVSTPPPAVIDAIPALAAAFMPAPLQPREVPAAALIAPQEELVEDRDLRSPSIAMIAARAEAEAAKPSANPSSTFVQKSFRRSRLKGVKKRFHAQLEPARTAFVPAPTLIEWQQPEDDVPPLDDISSPIEKIEVSANVDEITHVRPVRRVEVEGSKPGERLRPEIAAEYLPTLFAEDQRSESGEDTLFAGYQAQGRGVGRLPIYGVAMAALVLVGFGVFSLGSALTDDSEGYIGENRPAPLTIQAPAAQPAPSAPQVAVANIPAQIVEVPAHTTAEETAAAIQDLTERVAETSRPTTPVSQKRPKAEKTEVTQIRQAPAAKAPIVPSTLVITAGRSKAEVIKEPSSRVTRSTKTNAGATRPRIVGVQD